MKTVLIVEDEKLIRQGLAAMLRRAPVAVETVLEARNGLEGLRALEAGGVDVLITDVRMPGMDGMELVQRAAALPQPPLALVISGYDDFNYAVSMLRSGVRDYLLKPVEREKLYEALEKLEKELNARSGEAAGRRAVALQALRCLMAEQPPAPAERAALAVHAAELLPAGAYRVLCLRAAAGGCAPVCVPMGEGLCAACAAEDAAGPQSPAGPGELAGCSAPHQGAAELRAAYAEAREAFLRGYFDDAAGLRVYAPQAFAENACPEEETTLLMQYAAASRWPEAARLLQKNIAAVREGRRSPDAAAALVTAFVRRLMDTYRAMLPAEEEPEVLRTQWQYAGVTEADRALQQWLEGFAARLSHECEDYRNKQKIRDAVQYVRQNFAQPLNMTLVSNQVSMNYSLFSLLFKEYVGTNFVVYLQKLRVEEACRLLCGTEMYANEIGRRVGFADDKNFLKVFKAHCGLSPTEYRRAHQLAQAAADQSGRARPAEPKETKKDGN